MKLNRRQLRNILLKEARTVLSESSSKVRPEVAASLAAAGFPAGPIMTAAYAASPSVRSFVNGKVDETKGSVNDAIKSAQDEIIRYIKQQEIDFTNIF